MKIRTLLLDNYDSFTFNLKHLLTSVNGREPIVVRNDELGWEELVGLGFDNVVISPGPGRPERARDFGICRRVVLDLEVPILGVCLGHQGIAHFAGAEVVLAPEPVHGRVSRIFHQGADLFAGLPQGFEAVRYHSLMVASSLPRCLERLAWTDDGIVMALRRRERPQWGVQFHPESVGTACGRQLLENFRDLTADYWSKTGPRPAARARSAPRRPQAAPAAAPRQSGAARGLELHARQLPFWPDPETSFNRLFRDDRTAFWLDSSLVRPGTSRFSFMGGDGGPHARSIRYFSPERRLIIEQQGETTEAQRGLFEFLAAEIPRRAGGSQHIPCGFGGGFVGYFGYELKAECGGSARRRSEDPDSILLFPDRFLAFDHACSRAYLLCLAGRGESGSVRRWFEETEERLRHAESLAPEPGQSSRRRLAWRLEDSRPEYLRKIGRCLEAIRAGESYQVCLTNRLRCRTDADPLSVYRLLRKASPAPYSAFLRLGDLAIACSSPERFLKIHAAGRVESKPIKGTCPRGRTPEEDARLREALASDAKNRSENLMIVDLVRNDLSKVCRTGSVQVAKLMDIETYATVHHMVSTVRGRLRPGATAVDCLRACFPGGSMTGAPKLRTMEIIDTLEESARGVYSGCLGYLGLDGSADLNIVIRTAVFKSGQATVGTGGAIVALSDPAEEFDEAMLKARAVVEAVAAA